MISPASQSSRLRVRGLDVYRNHDRNFWILYAASFLVDLGLCLYFFMFSLFLVEHHFTEQSIGYITAALTVGTIAGTIPASLLARRFDFRTMMLFYLFTAPVCLASRALFLQMSAQMLLAFVAGVVGSIWSVCFSPTLARFTNRHNRASGFSLFVATGIASGALAGLFGGYFPGLLARIYPAAAHSDSIRTLLLIACGIVCIAAFVTLRLRIGPAETPMPTDRIFSRFLFRFLIAIATWSFAMGFFSPFANVYLSHHLGLPLTRIGEIFTISQLVQVAAVLFAPALHRRVGLIAGIAIAQATTGLLLLSLSYASNISASVCIYLIFTGFQWMSGPGIVSLLMNRTSEGHRGKAIALYNLVNLATQASAAAFAGKAFERFGYIGPLQANAALAVLAAVLLYSLLRSGKDASELRLAVSQHPRSIGEDGEVSPGVDM